MAEKLGVPEGYEPVAPTQSTLAPPEGYEPVATPGLAESFGRGLVEGGTFGFDDKLGMDKTRREASRKANPWTHFMGELAGGVAPMVAASFLPGGQPAAAGQAANLLTRGAGLVRAALVPGEIGTLGQAAGQGLKLGTTYGGISGAGHADVKDEDSYADALGKRLVGGLKGGAEGAVVGPVLGAAGHGLYRGAQNVGNLFADATSQTAGAGKGALVTATRKLEQDRITPQQVIDNILDEFPSASDSAQGGLARRFWGNATGGNRQPITREQVEEVVRRRAQDESPAQISAALSPGGKGTGPGEAAIKSLLGELEDRHLGPLNLVDRASMVRPGAGDNTQMSMRAAAATPGEHVGIAREGLLERQVGAQGRFGQLFDRMLGSPDYESVAAKHATDLQNAGVQAYGQAFANEAPFNLSNVFDKWSTKYGSYRGPIPDAINNEIRGFMTTGQNGGPPNTLEGFIFARQGLYDAIQSAKVDRPNLAKELTGLYNDLTSEVARTNPAWKTANDIWRDGKAAQEAMEAGARMTTRLSAGSRENLAEFTTAQTDAAKATEQLQKATRAILGPKTRRAADASELATASPAQRAAVEQAQARVDAGNARQELFKVGLVRSLNDMLANQGETHNLTKQLLLPGAQKMLRQVLGKDADQFFRTVRAEQAMHRTYQSQFGSQTTPLKEHIAEQTWAPRFETSMFNPLTWANPALRLAQEYAARTINARRNTDLMKLYTETDPLKQLDALRAMQTLHAARSQAGNMLGKPVVSAAGPGSDALLGLQSGMEYRPDTIKPYRP